MALFLFHPGMLKFSCSDCQRFVYDFKTGQPKTYKSGPERVDLPYAQGKNPPCMDGSGFKCPKGDPSQEPKHILTERNRRTLLLYWRGRVSNFSGWDLDPLAADNLAIIDGIYREYERLEIAEASQSAVVQMMPLLLHRPK